MPESSLKLGSMVELEGQLVEIEKYLDLRFVVVRDSKGSSRQVPISDVIKAIGAPKKSDGKEGTDSSSAEKLTPEAWTEANRIYEILKPLIENANPTRADAQAVARNLQKHVSTVYRLLNKLNENGMAALAPVKPNGGRGKARINDIADDITCAVIREDYLTTLRPKPSSLMLTIRNRCKRAGVKAPHENTVRLRIQQLGERQKAIARVGKKALFRYSPAEGVYEGAEFPNQVWQIDHTPLDVCIVDDVYRKNIGRPWLTLVIDVFSRCVAGFYLSLEKPNAASVGLALVHAILPKEAWLASHGIDAVWPVWGKPITVHADNDKTFRCDTVKRAAAVNRIALEWRPVATPHWGAHIERLLGTLNHELQNLPGSTFSNPVQRGDYKPHEEAIYTFGEIEEHLTKLICGIYHQRKHSGIGRPPIRKLEAGFLGEGDALGTGLPEVVKDREKLRIDFLPMTLMTVQRNGVTWDNITYYDPVLDPWILANNPDNTNKRRKFILKRDPRDISQIWFLDPDKDRYFGLPYRRIEHPCITLWELNEVRSQLKARGIAEVDEDLIFKTHDDLVELKSNASQKTQAARKEAQRKKTHGSKKKAEAAQAGVTDQTDDPLNGLSSKGNTWDNLLDDNIRPFEVE